MWCTDGIIFVRKNTRSQAIKIIIDVSPLAALDDDQPRRLKMKKQIKKQNCNNRRKKKENHPPKTNNSV